MSARSEDQRPASRTTTPQDPPLEWILAKGEGFSVIDEIHLVLKEVPSFERDMREEELFDVLSLASAGELSEGETLQPVRLNPVLWELRFAFTAGQYRLYFGEPVADESILVGTRFHLKDLDGTDSEIQSRQDDEMKLASERLEEGESDRWGWPL